MEVLWQKTVGILLEKQPLPGDQRSPLGISKSYLSKNLQLGDANISGGFLRSWRGPLAKAVGIFLEKQKYSPSLKGPTIPRWWEFQKVTSLKIFNLGMLNISGGNFLKFPLLEVLWQKP